MKKYKNNTLQLEVDEAKKEIIVKWSGKSAERDPSIFLNPILSKILEKSISLKKGIIFDFKGLQYMNSSTITPIIKILEKVKSGKGSITIIYQKSLKWQDLSFSALDIFKTADDRIQIKGL
jgi:hypothetical protein